MTEKTEEKKEEIVEEKKEKKKRGAPYGNKYAQKFIPEEIVEKARDYILNTQKYGDVVPTIEGLAVVIGISRDQLYEIAKKNKIVSDTLKLLNTHQSKKLITGGLLNKFNSNIVKLLLYRHGYVEKAEVEETKKMVILLDSSDSSLNGPKYEELPIIKRTLPKQTARKIDEKTLEENKN